MDPNENLRELLRLAKNPDEWDHHNGLRLAELILALDEWIRKGGFLPDAWKVALKRYGKKGT